ncbi:MAG: hypothetical protein PHF20_02025, partial [Halothiobacillaceae bacterium]|nr:hypothetical protein [Halothiobacillaceae bacterium]
MISEKNIAAEFKGFWSEYLPLLTPAFVRVFNEASLDDLTDHMNPEILKVPIGTSIEKHDLVAEFSFQLAKLAHESSLCIDEIRFDNTKISEAYINTTSYMQRYKTEDGAIVLNNGEISEALLIAEQYNHFIDMQNRKKVEFSPKISGAGFLGVCKADLSISDTLYEVKTVSRNISGQDIKQLIIYLELQFSTGERRLTHAVFYNPRK